MGPLFSLGLMAIAGAIAFVSVFVAATLVWRLKFAACFALVTVLGGFVGSALGLLVQIPFWPETLEGVGPVVYLGLGAAAGLSGASGAGYLLVRGWRVALRWNLLNTDWRP